GRNLPVAETNIALFTADYQGWREDDLAREVGGYCAENLGRAKCWHAGGSDPGEAVVQRWRQ
ncbi:hypothetical protein, partial [Novosphingobium sp. fls2-241-R2A-195]|uniref:hypothetical protein n=1 Tax=Novosphingobium sp. fls2-241-R2A-195 TaxID=3040296 RepID=UPI00254E6527